MMSLWLRYWRVKTLEYLLESFYFDDSHSISIVMVSLKSEAAISHNHTGWEIGIDFCGSKYYSLITFLCTSPNELYYAVIIIMVVDL